MNDELFHQLTASLKEGGAILRGKTPASRTSSLQWPVGWRGAASIRRWISSALEMRVACASVSALWLAAGPRCGRATARPVVTIPGCRPGTGCPLDGLNPARNPRPRPAQPKRRGGLRPSRRTPHLRRAGAAQVWSAVASASATPLWLDRRFAQLAWQSAFPGCAPRLRDIMCEMRD